MIEYLLVALTIITQPNGVQDIEYRVLGSYSSYVSCFGEQQKVRQTQQKNKNTAYTCLKSSKD